MLKGLGPALSWRIGRLRRRSPALDALCWAYGARPRVVEVQGIRLRIGYHLSAVVLDSILDGDYEERELGLLRGILAPTDTVMELGTGLGFLATFCARQIGSSRVATYEANPRMERHIQANFALNRVAPTLTMCLVGPDSGERTFYLSRDVWASSTIKRSPRTVPITVPVRSFNEEVKRVRPTLLVVDIEGGEVELAPRMDLSGVRAIVIELHQRVTGPEGVEVVKRAFKAQGFRIEDVGEAEHCVFVR